MFARCLTGIVAAIIVTGGVVSAQTCSSQQSAVNSLKQEIERDKKAIKAIGFNTDAAEFNSLANAEAAQQDQMMKQASYKKLAQNLANAALGQIGDSASGALTPQPGLPNGYASLNPINVKKYINQLDDPKGPVAWLLRQVASTSDKTTKLKLLAGFPRRLTNVLGDAC